MSREKKKEIFEIIIYIKLQIPEAQRIPSRINIKTQNKTTTIKTKKRNIFSHIQIAEKQTQIKAARFKKKKKILNVG